MRGTQPGTGAQSDNDLWPMLIEFTLSQRAWWIEICAEVGLTAMQAHTLRMLDPDHPVAMSTLAESLCCDASNVTGIVDKLESRGLIARQGAVKDRRIKMLAVTDKGRRLRDKLWMRIMEPPAAVATLPAQSSRRLADLLRTIVAKRTTRKARTGGGSPGK